MSRRPLMLLVLAVLIVAATACGGSATNDYRSGVAALQGRNRDALRGHEQALARAIAARRPAVAAREAAAASALIGATERAVAALAPPAALQRRSQRLLSAYRELVQSLDQISADLRTRKLGQANTAIDRYNTARLDESSAVAALNAGSS